jgi:outer membrane protein TolC
MPAKEGFPATVSIPPGGGFKDKELDRLVDLALRANHDRRIASARLREVRTLWSETSLDRYPTVTAGASYSKSIKEMFRWDMSLDQER